MWSKNLACLVFLFFVSHCTLSPRIATHFKGIVISAVPQNKNKKVNFQIKKEKLIITQMIGHVMIYKIASAELLDKYGVQTAELQGQNSKFYFLKVDYPFWAYLNVTIFYEDLFVALPKKECQLLQQNKKIDFVYEQDHCVLK